MKLVYCCCHLLLLGGIVALLLFMPMTDRFLGGKHLTLPVRIYDTPGDIDGNGIIDLNDVGSLQRIYLEPGNYELGMLRVADLNQDSVIDTYDTAILLKYLSEENPAQMPPEVWFRSFSEKEE